MALWSLGTNNLFISESIHPKNQWTRSSVHCQCQGFIRKSEIRFIYKLQCQDKIYGSSFDSYLNSPKIYYKRWSWSDVLFHITWSQSTFSKSSKSFTNWILAYPKTQNRDTFYLPLFLLFLEVSSYLKHLYTETSEINHKLEVYRD